MRKDGTNIRDATSHEATISPPDKQPECGAIIIDGSSLVYSLSPKTSKTFEEYAVQDVVPKIQAYSSKYERTDIIFDVYWTSSLKAETRSNRGKGGRRRVTDKTKLPPNWKSFLRDNENKTELFGFLAEKIVTLCPDNVVVVTKGEQALSNKPISLEGLSPCNHEEADSRIFTHALHATKQQIKSVLIKACDTDILVVAVNVFATLQDAGLEKIWIEFGQGQSIRWLPIHDMVVNLGPENSSGMLFFHAFTGCDVVSAFRGKSKKSAWQAWEVCPEVSPVFKKLSQYPPIIEDADLNILEKFVITMYDKQSTTCKVDEARLDLFARKQRSYDAIPPTSASLVQHVKRSAFQAACIWGQATVCKMQTESLANWGWQKDGQIWQVLWTTLPPIAQTCEQLTKCGCKTECQGRCKCYRFGLKCTQLCACACEG
ncbi:Venom prothrombin activator pseutarin-C non-catalytic subunit [Labeo rohita]|uniref:Venom prothrombin activator pseutarin-C non-catalytic subunit n=1 Tax=Labeo rohita TaxID=84645 RepID=A0A498NFG5_LABRO|nr:Venom prothrombin activator pseutarin-C non-catalytic subunit [Labeo rohita]